MKHANLFVAVNTTQATKPNRFRRVFMHTCIWLKVKHAFAVQCICLLASDIALLVATGTTVRDVQQILRRTFSCRER